MKPEQLIAELEAALHQGESHDWRLLAPLLLDAWKVARAAIERLGAERDEARAELARLTTPRPIEEAPKDGTPILGLVDGEWRALWWWDDIIDGARWHLAYTQIGDYKPTHFLPLPAKP